MLSVSVRPEPISTSIVRQKVAQAVLTVRLPTTGVLRASQPKKWRPLFVLWKRMPPTTSAASTSSGTHHQDSNHSQTAITPCVSLGSSASISSKVLRKLGMIFVIITISTTIMTTISTQG